MLTRHVGADLSIRVVRESQLAVQIAAAMTVPSVSETVEVTRDGSPTPYTKLAGPTGSRTWIVEAAPGLIDVRYAADLPVSDVAPTVHAVEQLCYARPSRYCESDRMSGLAAKLFHDITEPADLLAGVSSWVGTHLDYVSGSSGPTDGAVDTLLAGRGVCRDFAHLAVCLLRGLGIPARLTAVYAPGLSPMDFHAVAEALIDDAWRVVDPTLLAPRECLVRIATGRDAADTAFLSNTGGQIELESMTVTATVDGDLPADDITTLVSLT